MRYSARAWGHESKPDFDSRQTDDLEEARTWVRDYPFQSITLMTPISVEVLRVALGVTPPSPRET